MTNKEAQFATLSVALEHNRIMHILNNRDSYTTAVVMRAQTALLELKLRLKNDKNWKI